MSLSEHLFDINNILRHSYSSLKQLRETKQIELIFEMDSHIPRELRGNDVVLQQLLVKIFTFILQHSQQKEVLLTLSAPEDFMYEELITFQIKETHIPKEKVLAFLETGLGNNLTVLDGKIIYDKESDIHLEIPFTISELGFRRYYRLPMESMLDKKVLLIVESEYVSSSITKMFKYFSYEVDIGFSTFKENKTELSAYDVVVIEERLVTESFLQSIGQIQEGKDLKYVLFGNGRIRPIHSAVRVSGHLIKPVTQESILELIILLFEHNDFQAKKKISEPEHLIRENKVANVNIPVPENLQNKSEKSNVDDMIEDKKAEIVPVLDTKVGLEIAKKKGVVYAKELQNFLESFDKSDLYFRQIVNEKQTNKIKDFCIDLEKESKMIGAESMQKFSDIISLIFVYNKLDMLPVYPGRYHMELTKLVGEIKKYLHIT